jgi:hypothetical protein
LWRIKKDEGRFRANSDNTAFNIQSRAFKQASHLQLPSQKEPPARRLSRQGSFFIREDYFTADKNRFFYQMSTRNSGSMSSEGQQSVKSISQQTDKSKQQPAFVPAFHQLPTTQGSSSILKSSLEATLANFESQDLYSHRPSR